MVSANKPGMTRRDALRLGVYGAAALAAPAFLRSDGVPAPWARPGRDANALRFGPNPVSQGAASTWVGGDLKVVSRLGPPRGSITSVQGTVALFKKGAEKDGPISSKTVTGYYADDFRVRAEFNGLDPGHYTYRVCGDELSDRSFWGNTHSSHVRPILPEPLAPRNFVRIHLAACQKYTDGYWDVYPFAQSRNPDAIIFGGDTIYADSEQTFFSRNRIRKDVSPYADVKELFLMKYLACMDRDLKGIRQNIPLYGTPGDHESRNNVDGGAGQYERLVRDGHLAYGMVYPGANEAEINGFYRRVDFGQGTRILILDTRRFRTPTDMLGETQFKWLFDEFANAKSDNVTRLLILTSEPFTAGREGMPDSWAGYPEQRQRVIDELVRNGLGGIATFLSSDYHTNLIANVRQDPLNPKADVIAHEFSGGAISSHIKNTHNVSDNVLAFSRNGNSIMEIDSYEDGRMVVTFFMYDARIRGYVPESAARFVEASGTKLGVQPLIFQQVDTGRFSNPGGLALLR
ncbi:MAG TPA: alkaline phosphatase D family protein [Acidimicrobiia bacterium]|nr:alkaline phosphatase D family protein [Acidimicrobiia bacterium]